MTEDREYMARVAEFWARLASAPSWEELRESERLRFAEDLKVLSAPREEHLGADALNTRTALELLPRLHDIATQVIAALVDGGVVKPPKALAESLVWVLVQGGRRVQEVWSAHTELPDAGLLIEPVLVQHLFRLIHLSSFPFRRCDADACPRIFVRYRHQRYCSPTCAVQVTEAARKESKRDYMRQRRKEAKQGRSVSKGARAHGKGLGARRSQAKIGE